jgi:predicted Zn-dependent peptidase
MEIINIKNVNEKVYHELLPSGLNVYIYTSELTNTYDMKLVVHVGSRDNHFKVNGKEVRIPNGVAHFLEHLTFNTKDGTAEDHYAKLGAYINAGTTFDNTTYTCSCNDDFIDNLIYLLNFVTEPFYNKELVEKERGIILEEILMHMNDVDEKFYYNFLDNIFVNDTNKNQIGGIDTDVKNISLDDIVNTYNCFYKKNNMDLILTGNIDVEETINKLREWDKENVEKSDIINLIESEPDEVNKLDYVYNDNVSTNKMFIGLKLNKNKANMDEVEFDIYTSLLSDLMFGESSDMRLMCEKEHFVDGYVDSFFVRGFNHKVLSIEFESEDLDNAYKKIIDYINNFKVNKEDLDRKIKASLARIITSFENPNRYGHMIANDLVRYNKLVDNYYEIFNSINIDKMNDILDLYKNSNITYIKLLPKK